jgi:hypothetical protein|nr:MAG TPA: Protein of unknown function (DUF3800) [Caudoviricetes sp.]
MTTGPSNESTALIPKHEGDYFVYADETGNLDFKSADSPYFGFGTAMFPANHATQQWDAHLLRLSLQDQGVSLPNGFHAAKDSWKVRRQVFSMLADQEITVDSTFLYKANAYKKILLHADPQMRLYKMAWYLHFKDLCQRRIPKQAHIYAIVASFGTKMRAETAREALKDVADQQPQDITLCIWDSASCFGLQAADYALWAINRHVSGRALDHYEDLIEPYVRSVFLPWGNK